MGGLLQEDFILLNVCISGLAVFTIFVLIVLWCSHYRVWKKERKLAVSDPEAGGKKHGIEIAIQTSERTTKTAQSQTSDEELSSLGTQLSIESTQKSDTNSSSENSVADSDFSISSFEPNPTRADPNITQHRSDPNFTQQRSDPAIPQPSTDEIVRELQAHISSFRRSSPTATRKFLSKTARKTRRPDTVQRGYYHILKNAKSEKNRHVISLRGCKEREAKKSLSVIIPFLQNQGDPFVFVHCGNGEILSREIPPFLIEEMGYRCSVAGRGVLKVQLNGSVRPDTAVRGINIVNKNSETRADRNTIDLHYCNRREAAKALALLLPNCAAKGMKSVLIDCGKGIHSEDGIGVLKEVIPSFIVNELYYRVSPTKIDGQFSVRF